METTIKAIIVDDEEGARIILRALLEEYCPQVKIVKECSNVPDAVLAINKEEPDVVFLDIEMPEYNGFELINFFKKIDFEIIFVTAYSQYAIRAFEVSAVDYLLKPVDIDALQKAVEKVKNKRNISTMQERLDLMKTTYSGEDFNKIALPLNEGLLFVDVADVCFFEADRVYTLVVLKDKTKHIISKPLKTFEELLENRPYFFRPHRSYLINLRYVKKYMRREAMVEMDNGATIAIARNSKQEFEDLLKELNLVL